MSISVEITSAPLGGGITELSDMQRTLTRVVMGELTGTVFPHGESVDRSSRFFEVVTPDDGVARFMSKLRTPALLDQFRVERGGDNSRAQVLFVLNR